MSTLKIDYNYKLSSSVLQNYQDMLCFQLEIVDQLMNVDVTLNINENESKFYNEIKKNIDQISWIRIENSVFLVLLIYWAIMIITPFSQ